MKPERRFTYVCVACCAGWEQDKREKTVHKPCGTEAELRGAYQVIDLFPKALDTKG
jgi:hypothetical protein